MTEAARGGGRLTSGLSRGLIILVGKAWGWGPTYATAATHFLRLGPASQMLHCPETVRQLGTKGSNTRPSFVKGNKPDTKG